METEARRRSRAVIAIRLGGEGMFGLAYGFK